jgi:S-adenosyl-L-methionine hydrolase (adenosine-forming)
MARPIITLTTDFGLSDHFAGTMKGVILGICPTAEIIDISHEITPFEIPEAAFTIAQAYAFFPKKTVHAIIVDPGVGTSRRPILAEAGGQYFVAPDNGVLTMILSHEKARVRHITNAKYFLKDVSQTFHGRDVFAPAAAHLAKGEKPSKFGKAISDYSRLGFEKPAHTARRAWTGVVLKADRFGNLITNFHISDFPKVATNRFQFAVGPEVVSQLAHSYGECRFGGAFAIVGSSGFVEISSNQSSAAKLLGCGVGSPVELTVY